MENKKILIVDDEKKLVLLLCDFLKNAGFDTICAFDGSEGLELFRENKDSLSLAVIDIMMPQIDGWELTRKIRKESSVPIIMLSARAEEFDLLEGFSAGIDEYVTKPFSPAVLVKRIEALIRRNSNKSDLPNKNEGLIIDNSAYAAFLNGDELILTLKEFELLSYLVENKSRVLSREQLLDAIWGFDYLGDTRTVDSHIARLRTKLGEFGIAHLKTVYGMGYKFEA